MWYTLRLPKASIGGTIELPMTAARRTLSGLDHFPRELGADHIVESERRLNLSDSDGAVPVARGEDDVLRADERGDDRGQFEEHAFAAAGDELVRRVEDELRVRKRPGGEAKIKGGGSDLGDLALGRQSHGGEV